MTGAAHADLAAAALLTGLLLTGCARYADFQLPAQPGHTHQLIVEWKPRPAPVLSQGAPGAWDSHDVLNPSVIRSAAGYLNLYSGFDGKTWRTGAATSADGISWTKSTQILGPDLSTWEGSYIAGNGALIAYSRLNGLAYYYQAGRPPRIGLARASSGSGPWKKEAQPVLGLGPYGSWDEWGVADPYVIEDSGSLYMFYLGMDRAQRQRLGVATSTDGASWTKLRSNPVLELGSFGTFDESGLGEPAVWASNGFYWMLYTGRDHAENRRLGLARSTDGVHWEKRPEVFSGTQPWASKVLCDPTVLIENGEIRVWFGGGDVARPDEEIHGRIGYGVLTITDR
ncbi:MAG: hypothetical protein M3Y27_09465 [Acidobacteriota bacterium]|nr:hypothetical protein [Acidobacteriota bacterium]